MIIDVTFYIILLVAVFKGYSKGFIVGIFSFIAIIIGLAAALKLSVVAAHYLDSSPGGDSRWLPVISFAIVFIAVVLLVHFAARIIKKTISMAMLGWVDRLGGIVFYLLIYTIVFSVILFFAEKTQLLHPETISKSSVYPYVAPWGPRVINGLGKIIPVFKDLFTQLELFFENLGHKLAMQPSCQILFSGFFGQKHLF
jgi:membrane protein required for colicin V production